MIEGKEQGDNLGVRRPGAAEEAVSNIHHKDTKKTLSRSDDRDKEPVSWPFGWPRSPKAEGHGKSISCKKEDFVHGTQSNEMKSEPRAQASGHAEGWTNKTIENEKAGTGNAICAVSVPILSNTKRLHIEKRQKQEEYS